MAVIGLMIHSVVFENPTQLRTYTGGTTATYVPFLTTKASFRKSTGRRLLESGAVIFSNTWEIECHFTPSLLSSVSEKTRVLVDGKTMMVLNYELIDQKKFYYRFTLRSNE